MILPLRNKIFTTVSLIIAGCLQTLTLAPFDYWILGPLSIALILWSTKALEPRVSNSNTTTQDNDNTQKQKGFLYGWLFGLGLFGSGASWVYVSINTYGHAPPPLAAALTLFFVAGLALFSALVFWLHFKFKTKHRLTNSLLFLALWVLGDGFRTVFLTGFPWLFLGYGHLESPLAGWIPLIGVHGISLLVVATGIALTLLLSKASAISKTSANNKTSAVSKNLSRLKLASCALILFIWAAGFPLNEISWSSEIKPPLSVALIQTNIPQEEKWKASQRKKTLQLLDKMTTKQWQNDSQHTDLIIWPETAVPLLYDQALPFLNRMSKRATENGSNIISGIPFRSYDKKTNSQTLHNSITSIGKGDGIYHKQKLVPFGEYVPLQDILRGLIAFFDLPMSDFRRGASEQALLKSFDNKVAPFICYEVVYPDFVASRAREADYLLTISNDSWFGNSIGPLQHLEMAQIRAAENSRYMIRGTNNGISAIIDEQGKLLDQSEQFVRTVLESEVKILSGRTPFSYFGSLPVFLLCGLYLLVHLIRLKKRTS